MNYRNVRHILTMLIMLCNASLWKNKNGKKNLNSSPRSVAAAAIGTPHSFD